MVSFLTSPFPSYPKWRVGGGDPTILLPHPLPPIFFGGGRRAILEVGDPRHIPPPFGSRETLTPPPMRCVAYRYALALLLAQRAAVICLTLSVPVVLLWWNVGAVLRRLAREGGR